MNYEDRVTKEYVEGLISGPGTWEKIFDVTTPENTIQYDVDVSGVDLTQYAQLYLHVTSPDGSYVQIRTNGIGESTYQRASDSGSSTSTSNCLIQIDGPILFSFYPPKTGQRIVLMYHRPSLGGSSMSVAHYTYAAEVTWDQLTSLNFINHTLLPAGCRFALYGMKL